MNFGDDRPVGDQPSPVDLALDQLAVSLDHLVKLVEDRGLDTFDDAQLVGFLHRFEQVRNRLPLVDHATIAAATRRNLAESVCQSTLTRMLAVTLRISPSEAARRVHAAEALTERMSMTGQPWAAGPAGSWPRRNEPGRSAPSRWRSLSGRWPGWTGPGSTRPTSPPGRSCSPGSPPSSDRKKKTRGEAVSTATGPDGQPIEASDPRHHGQRMHDALEDVCDRLLRQDTPVPDTGGTPATVIITIDIDDLLAKTGYGVASDGTLIRTDTVRAASRPSRHLHRDHQQSR